MTATAPVPSETPAASQGDAQPSPLGRLASQFSAWRHARVVSAETRAEQQRLRDETERRDEQQRLEELSQRAVSKRRRVSGEPEEETDEKLAPIPRGMLKFGVWSDRSVASVVLAAPLIVSGYYTVKTGMDAPLNMDQGIALAFTGGLEGSVWYLLQLRQRFRLEGYATFGLSCAIAGIITLIASMLLGHAIWRAMGSLPIDVQLPFTQVSVPLSDLVPAVAISLMSTIGSFVASKRATFKHRARLRAQKRLDTAGPRFSMRRRFWCPWETFWASRHATKYSLSSPELAVDDWRLWRMSGKPVVWPLVAETSQPEQERRETVRVLSETAAPRETSRPQLVSAPRAIAASPETERETVTVVTPDRPLVSLETGELDQVETVGRLRDGLRLGDGDDRREPLSYAKIALRLGISKAHAGRLGQKYDERLRLRPEGDETGVSVAN